MTAPFATLLQTLVHRPGQFQRACNWLFRAIWVSKSPAFLHVFCPTINGPKDAKMWPVRGFALHPKDVCGTLCVPCGVLHIVCDMLCVVCCGAYNVFQVVCGMLFMKCSLTHGVWCTTIWGQLENPVKIPTAIIEWWKPMLTRNICHGKHNMQYTTCSMETTTQKGVLLLHLL